MRQKKLRSPLPLTPPSASISPPPSTVHHRRPRPPPGLASSESVPFDHKKCGICKRKVTAGLGQAVFLAECSHSFHFPCISNLVSSANRHCPVCRAYWNNLPFTTPIPNNNTLIPPIPPPSFTSSHGPLPQFPQQSVEPPRFCDDEPLPATSSDTAASSGLQGVTIKVVPERAAVASSECASPFSVLVGLKAPSLPDDVQRAPIDIVTVLDVSGSMKGTKLELVKRAVHFVIDNLGISDRLSVLAFSDQATRWLPLRRMTETGREDAKKAVDSLRVLGGTNIVEGLKKGARVLEERRYRNPVTSVIFLSDGNDSYNKFVFQRPTNSSNAPGYLHLLPSSNPKNQGLEPGDLVKFPVHSFGFGSDHDPVTMHAISDASGGTFSFIESYEMAQDAFAGCIGGVLSVVTQELVLKVRSASNGVEIKSIPSGRHASGISTQGSKGFISVGDLYADEEKEFLINLFVPALKKHEAGEESKTSLLDLTCSYKDTASKEIALIEGVEIRRPKSVSPQDMVIAIEVDRQRNRLNVAESLQQAQQMAEASNLSGARTLLANKRNDLLASASAKAGDELCNWLESEMKETEKRMVTKQEYDQSGRAFTFAGMSSHAAQRATTRGKTVAGDAPLALGGYSTPNMANMVHKSKIKTEEDSIKMEK